MKRHGEKYQSVDFFFDLQLKLFVVFLVFCDLYRFDLILIPFFGPGEAILFYRLNT
jgi:hypothetical protein